MYSDPAAMVLEVRRELQEMGVRYQTATVQDREVADDPGYETVELSGYCYALTRVGRELLEAMLTDLAPDHHAVDWARAESRDRVAKFASANTAVGINPGYAWDRWPELWRQYLHGGRFSYTYAERIRAQLPQVVDELVEHPMTRQAVITIYDHHQDLQHRGGLARVPCSMHYQFLRREGRVDCLYVMRSCDFAKHFVCDVYLAGMLLCHIAEVVGDPPGRLTHFVGSLHAFRADVADAF